MQTNDLTIIILAAGEGTRMQSQLPKVLHRLCGRTMLGHVLHVAATLAAERTAIVLAPHTLDQVRATVEAEANVATSTYVAQAERRGTGHAVQQACHALVPRPGKVLVLYGDTPLLQASTAATLLKAMDRTQALVGLLSFQAHPATGYGRVVRDANGDVVELVEERNATTEQRAITEANSGVMAFQSGWLWEQIGQIQPNPVNQEYYLTDLVTMAVQNNGRGAAIAVEASDPCEAWGVNDRVQLAQAEAVLRQRVLNEWMRSGVTIIDPHNTYVEMNVQVGRDTTLLPGTLLRGTTRVGQGCTIGPHTTLINATIEDEAIVQHSVVEDQVVGRHIQLGPFAYVRPNTNID
jgi:bifunctional UDP-N-acetylglucosamine pyrophosphorylase/glucosamine-1-phosphate N-acetyltransferase